MFYALFNSNKLIGIFDTKDGAEIMINGLKQNNLCNNLSIRKYIKNSICRVSNTDKSNTDKSNTELNNIRKLTPDEEIKINKEKSELEYELLKLKKQQDNISESKKTYIVDLDLYNKFKKIKNENNEFIIPELFVEKYKVLK